MSTKKKKVTDKELLAELDQKPMIRTTMFLGEDLRNKLKKEAKKRSIGYQQLMREILSNHFSKKKSLEQRVKALEEALKEIA